MMEFSEMVDRQLKSYAKRGQVAADGKPILMSTEAQVKRAISAVLQKYNPYIYYHMPVPGGYGRSALDYIGFICGFGFAIEAKSFRNKPTPRQEGCIEAMQRAGAKVFVVNSHASLQELDHWLDSVTTEAAPLPVVG